MTAQLFLEQLRKVAWKMSQGYDHEIRKRKGMS